MKARVLRLAKLALVTGISLASLLAVSGCWNSRELNKLAIVTAMAIDRVPDSNNYELAFQVVMPGALSHTGTGGNDSPFSIYGIRAPTMFEGIRKASKQVPRQLFFSHVQVVVLGERLAKEGIEEVFDFFERSHEVRLTSMLLVARGTPPDKLISTYVPLERLQASALLGEGTLSAKVWSETAVIEIDEVIRRLINTGAEPIISGLKLIGNDKTATQKKSTEQSQLPYHLEISDIAMFREGKLADWLENESARGLMFVGNHIGSTIMNLECGGKPDGVALEILKSRTSNKVYMKDGQLKVDVVVSAESNVGEVKCGIAIEKLDTLQQLEREWSDAVKSEIHRAVKQAQAIKADVFGFGMSLQRHHPKQWNAVKDDWGSVFAKAEVNVTFRGIIRRTGMRGKSLLEKS
ncbi:Ger(x)C family spore germination protein [Cohnella yongneupensis]|uniref:Ger(X)C family spore germination protein n=1 Tax=Cohnella yongneupensis TaxID=425006 RepID=A0ABW0R7W6_9BACL